MTYPSRERPTALTERELDILRLVADGLTNQQIADQLVITVGTVRWYTKQIFGKLNVHNRTHAVAQARALGILSGPAQLQQASTPGQLPVGLPPFFGREESLLHIATHLGDPSCRLLTLVGSGGIGKTRLAIEAARQHENHFVDGIYFVDLVGIRAGSQVLPAILESMGVALTPTADPWQQLCAHVRDRALLLVIDNFEQVLSEAILLSNLLAAAPHVKIIVTSREVLRLDDEWVYTVEGMELPIPDDKRSLNSFGAVQLFVDRAQRVRSDLAPDHELNCIARICRLVQGIPLAIELAASRLRQQSCEEIANTLTRNSDVLVTAFRNVPERHRSMRAVFTWSWDLLSESEQRAFMRLSVFRGGCTEEAAAVVTGSSLTTLFALVDKSLLGLYSNHRYYLQEILRQYAYEKLLNHKLLKQAKDAHLNYFLAFTESLMSESFTHLAWRSRLEQDYDNIRAAFEWCQSGEGSPKTGLRLAVATFHYWRVGLYLGEGLKYTTQLLNKLPKSETPQLRAKASVRAAWLAVVLGDLTQAESLIRTCFDVDAEQNDLWTKALALNILGTVRRSYADYPSARRLYDLALQTSELVGDPWLIALSVGNQGVLAFHQDDKLEAIRRLEQVLPLFQTLNDDLYVTFVRNLLGRLMRQIGQYQRAFELCQSELLTAIRIQDRWAIALGLSGLAALCASLEWYDGAARLLGIEASLRTSLGAALSPSIIPDHEATIAVVREHLDPASWNAFWADGYALTLEQAIPVLIDGLGVVAAQLDQNKQDMPAANAQLPDPLTPREMEILRLLAAGLTNQEIAKKYVVATGTISAHTHRIFVKLDVPNRTLAVTKAYRLKLL